MVIYQQLLWDLKPKTIFEIGANTGACALWMVDTMKAYNLPVHVHSVDKNLSLVDEMALNDQNVTIIEGNVLRTEEVYSDDLLKRWAHAWIISEDCHVNVNDVMEYFHKYMKEGDYIIIEDINSDSPSTAGQCLLDLDYQRWGDEKLNLLQKFFHKCGAPRDLVRFLNCTNGTKSRNAPQI